MPDVTAELDDEFRNRHSQNVCPRKITRSGRFNTAGP
jgi:hypothetical protein